MASAALGDPPVSGASPNTSNPPPSTTAPDSSPQPLAVSGAPPPSVSRKAENHPYLGIVYIVISAVFYSIMSLAVKLSGGRIGAYQQIWSRCIVSLAGASVFLWRQGINPIGYPTWQVRYLLARGGVGFINMVAYFYSLSVLSFADAQVIAFTSTVMTGVLGRLLLGEAFGYMELGIAWVAFVGLMFVVQPAALFGAAAGAAAAPPGVTAQQRTVGVVVALIGALFGALIYIVMRKLGPGVSVHSVSFVLSGSAGGGAFVMMLATGSGVWPRGVDWLHLLAIAVSGYLVMLSFNRGCQLEDAVVANLVRVLDIPLALGFQLMLGESLTAFSALGTVLIMGAIIGLGVYKLRLRRDARAKADQAASALEGQVAASSPSVKSHGYEAPASAREAHAHATHATEDTHADDIELLTVDRTHTRTRAGGGTALNERTSPV